MIREPGKLIDESKSTDPLQFLILTDQAAKTPLLTIFHMINSFSLRGHPFWPVKNLVSYFLASYFMQMKFEISELEFRLATSLFYIFIPEVASRHVQVATN